MVSPLLSLDKATKSFGGLTAVWQVSFDVKPGGITALIGPNGAGKTTLFNLISGAIPLSAGKINFDGRDITNHKPHRIAKAGITRTFQNIKLFHNRSALDNVLVGCHTTTGIDTFACIFRTSGERRWEQNAREMSMAALDMVGLADKAGQISGSLPFGQQRMLEIARAAVSKPKLILLDEPASGTSGRERDALAELILRLPKQGIAVLLVEHDMNVIMSISNSVVVLEYGVKIAEGTPKEIQQNERVIKAYLGEEAG